MQLLVVLNQRYFFLNTDVRLQFIYHIADFADNFMCRCYRFGDCLLGDFLSSYFNHIYRFFTTVKKQVQVAIRKLLVCRVDYHLAV